MPLTDVQVHRYSRHIVLPQVGGKGQERLLSSSAVIAFDREGEGAASVVATYLAAAGVGGIGWMPFDSGKCRTSSSGSLCTLANIYASAGLEESISELNPDTTLKVLESVPEYADGFDLLVLSGDAPALCDFAAQFKATGGAVIRGRRRGWAGVVINTENDLGFEESLQDGADSRLPAAPSEGVLGTLLASQAICALIKEENTVGSTVQALFDLSSGLFRKVAR